MASQTVTNKTGNDAVARGDADATVAREALDLRPIPFAVARAMLEAHHYLHSFPGGTRLAFGVFAYGRLAGALTLGVGPINAHRLVSGARRADALVLTRLWLADALPRYSESRTIGLLVRGLKQHTSIKFLVTYADPAAGHLGIIYQATNWLYTGLSAAMPRLDLGDGVPRHSRSVGSALGTHGRVYLRAHGIPVRDVPALPKHRYVLFIDRRWRRRLTVRVLAYPKRGGAK
jgi:hypothetical protein